MPSNRVVIIGSGIVGLAHAMTAREAGAAVTVMERTSRPLGASVRNFGTIKPLALCFGRDRDQALFGAERWRQLAGPAGYIVDCCGALVLAYRESAWQVLTEFAALPVNRSESFELLSPSQVASRFPMANARELKGALFSPYEIVLRPRDAMLALVDYAAKLGIQFHFDTCAIKVLESEVESADGRRFPFDQLVIAAGDDMRTLFPHELAAAGVRRCQLQMMRTRPVASRLNAMYFSDLTLRHYPAFEACPSLEQLRSELAESMAPFDRYGIHVIAAQHSDGSLTVGDSHEYADDFEPDRWECIDELILENLATFVSIPDLAIASRWCGYYLKSCDGHTQVILRPRTNVTMIAALTGLGMTLSWGMARQTVEEWSDPRTA